MTMIINTVVKVTKLIKMHVVDLAWHQINAKNIVRAQGWEWERWKHEEEFQQPPTTATSASAIIRATMTATIPLARTPKIKKSTKHNNKNTNNAKYNNGSKNSSRTYNKSSSSHYLSHRYYSSSKSCSWKTITTASTAKTHNNTGKGSEYGCRKQLTSHWVLPYDWSSILMFYFFWQGSEVWEASPFW